MEAKTGGIAVKKESVEKDSLLVFAGT